MEGSIRAQRGRARSALFRRVECIFVLHFVLIEIAINRNKVMCQSVFTLSVSSAFSPPDETFYFHKKRVTINTVEEQKDSSLVIIFYHCLSPSEF